MLRHLPGGLIRTQQARQSCTLPRLRFFTLKRFYAIMKPAYFYRRIALWHWNLMNSSPGWKSPTAMR